MTGFAIVKVYGPDSERDLKADYSSSFVAQYYFWPLEVLFPRIE